MGELRLVSFILLPPHLRCARLCFLVTMSRQSSIVHSHLSPLLVYNRNLRTEHASEQILINNTLKNETNNPVLRYKNK